MPQQIPSPTGTRDFYPLALARRRYIERAWRAVSVRHGFDEVDGPTFEHLQLYTVKSGDGIVSELFSFTRAGGDKDFALRPEFTPTLARLYAAQAAQLPKPTKWFWQSTCFRAERPQRGRLREFLQWNCDILAGEDRALADAEIIAVVIDLLATLGLKPGDVTVRINDRSAAASAIRRAGVTEEGAEGAEGGETETGAGPRTLRALALLDKKNKLKPEVFAQQCAELGLDEARYAAEMQEVAAAGVRVLQNSAQGVDHALLAERAAGLGELCAQLRLAGLADWCTVDPTIVRGLAYYTGTVFEVIAGDERALAGGGRYDNLVGLLGGPPTPAMGFGMGDVVLSLVLADKGLMPGDAELLRTMGLTPQVFVVSNSTPEADAVLASTLGALRGSGLHGRRSYKATKNIGKLLKEANEAQARVAMILESGATATVKDLATGVQELLPLDEAIARAIVLTKGLSKETI